MPQGKTGKLETGSQSAVYEPVGTHAIREEATSRVAAYCRSLGLRNEACLARVAKAILEFAEADQTQPGDEDLPRRAVQAAIRSVDHWMDDLVARYAGGASGPATRGLAFWRLRSVLGQYPESFLARDDIPAAYRKAIEAQGTPIVPPGKPAFMAPQSLGNVSPGLNRVFWFEVRRRARWFWQRTLSTLAGG